MRYPAHAADSVRGSPGAGIISARNPNEPRVVDFTHANAVLAFIVKPGKL
jgi:hypothetical protein